MLLHAIVLEADVQEGMFYDQRADEKRPSYSVNMVVMDATNKEKWDVQLTDGYAGLDELKDLKRKGATLEVLREAADRLREELPREFDHIDLDVLKIKGKQAPYLRLVCQLVSLVRVDQYAQYIQDLRAAYASHVS